MNKTKNRIKALREEFKISQKELASKMEVHQTAVSQWEHGRTAPDFEAINKLADIFGVTVDYLLGRSEIRKTSDMLSEKQKEALEKIRGLSEENLNKLIDYSNLLIQAENSKAFVAAFGGNVQHPKQKKETLPSTRDVPSDVQPKK